MAGEAVLMVIQAATVAPPWLWSAMQDGDGRWFLGWSKETIEEVMVMLCGGWPVVPPFLGDRQTGGDGDRRCGNGGGGLGLKMVMKESWREQEMSLNKL
ncbi:hypothetical protein Dimus_026510, partial [Dionaea muscipula]